MNTGAEAVETALKTARRWGYDVKGVPAGRAKIVTCSGNFHGRTITIVSFSSDQDARGGFGPFTPGFIEVPYGDADALEHALARPRRRGVPRRADPGRGGRRRTARGLPAPGPRAVRRQPGAPDGRRDPVRPRAHRPDLRVRARGCAPDLYILGKALGGGIVPLSAVVSRREVLGVFRPGEHGSTFGGNPLACAVGLEVLRLLRTGEYQRRADELGTALIGRGSVPRRPRASPRSEAEDCGSVSSSRPRPRPPARSASG